MSPKLYSFPFNSVLQGQQYLLTSLNVILIYRFMFGIYSGVFAVAIYLYFRKKNRTATQTFIVIGSLTVLYIFNWVEIVFTWRSSDYLFVRSSTTRSELFLVSVTGGNLTESYGVYLLRLIGSDAVILCADVLLVWRCYHVCSHSLRTFLLPITFLIAEAAVAIGVLVYDNILYLKPQDLNIHTVTIRNHLLSTIYVLSAMTSVISSVIICFKIYTHMIPGLRSSRHYRTIIDIIVQSSALSSMLAILQAIFGFVHSGELTQAFNIAISQQYVDVLYVIMNVLAPTLMVARLCLSSAQQDTAVFLSSATRSFEPCTYQSTPGSPVDPSGDDVEMQSKVAPSPDLNQEENNGIMIINRRDPTAEEA